MERVIRTWPVHKSGPSKKFLSRGPYNLPQNIWHFEVRSKIPKISNIFPRLIFFNSQRRFLPFSYFQAIHCFSLFFNSFSKPVRTSFFGYEFFILNFCRRFFLQKRFYFVFFVFWQEASEKVGKRVWRRSHEILNAHWSIAHSPRRMSRSSFERQKVHFRHFW